MLWRDRLVQSIFACHWASTYHIYARPIFERQKLKYLTCLNIYLFSYFVFARSVNSSLPRRMRRLVQMFAARRCGKHRLSAKYECKTQTIQRCDSLSRVSSVVIHLSSSEILQVFKFLPWADPEGERGPDPPPLENHKLYWFL